MTTSKQLQDTYQTGASDAQIAAPIRVLTVDDSALIRLTLSRHLNGYPDIDVIGQGRNGKELLQLVQDLKPDLVVLDVEMPEMNGIEALEQLMHTAPTPVIMLSNLTSTGAEITLQALEIGAVDFVVKPQPGVTMAETVALLVEKIRCAVRSTGQEWVQRTAAKRIRRSKQSTEKLPIGQIVGQSVAPFQSTDTLVAIASSTGGPTALTALLSSLPPGLPIGGVIIQHMPKNFTAILSQRLNSICAYRVMEAEAGAEIRRGLFLVAPGGTHLKFGDGGIAQLTAEPAVNGVRPAADVTMESLADLYRTQILAVVLTGMGRDGFSGAQKIQAVGGSVMAQSPESCVVYGMPRHVVEAQIAREVAAPEELGHFIAEWTKQ